MMIVIIGKKLVKKQRSESSSESSTVHVAGCEPWTSELTATYSPVSITSLSLSSVDNTIKLQACSAHIMNPINNRITLPNRAKDNNNDLEQSRSISTWRHLRVRCPNSDSANCYCDGFGLVLTSLLFRLRLGFNVTFIVSIWSQKPPKLSIFLNLC